MTRIDDAAWIPKAKKRKAYRDHYRDKFFKEVGMEKRSNEMGITGAPQKQRLEVVKLLNLTRKGMPEGAHEDSIISMAKVLSSTGLGKGIMGGVNDTQDDLEQYAMDKLRKFFRSPAFFD